MLLRTMFLLAFIVVLGETAVHAAGALAQSAVRRRATAAVQTEFERAVEMERAAIAQTIQTGGDPLAVPLPSPVATCLASDRDGCAIVVQTRVATASPAPSASPPACGDAACATYLQANDRVMEGRVAIAIASTATGPNANTLATRSAVVRFRTFQTAPYAAMAGVADATMGTLFGGGGDDGGATSGSPTLVNVEYLGVTPGSTPIPGSVWRPQTPRAAAAASAWEY